MSMLPRHTIMTPTGYSELILQGSASFPRCLAISWRPRVLTVRMWTPQAPTQTLVFAIANPSDVPNGDRSARLSVSPNGCGVLWISGAAFDLSPAEASEIQAKLGPLGLIVENDSNSTAPIGPSAAKESANTADPLGGARGERLAFVLNASPSEFNELFASALASRESY